MEKIITLIFPIYGIFMYFVREECSNLLNWAILSLMIYLVAFFNIELSIASLIAALLYIIIHDY